MVLVSSCGWSVLCEKVMPSARLSLPQGNATLHLYPHFRPLLEFKGMPFPFEMPPLKDDSDCLILIMRCGKQYLNNTPVGLHSERHIDPSMQGIELQCEATLHPEVKLYPLIQYTGCIVNAHCTTASRSYGNAGSLSGARLNVEW